MQKAAAKISLPQRGLSGIAAEIDQWRRISVSDAFFFYSQFKRFD
jgi:hypothetical protein